MIDRKRVAALHEDVGEEELGPLVALFLDEIEATILTLDMTGPARLCQRLQSLKDSARSLGLRALGLKCELWARSAAQGEVEGLDPGVLMACHARSRQLLMRDLAEMTGKGGDAA